LLKKVPFFFPTIWLGYFSSKRLSQNKRLQQEYAYKETNAKSFEGLKRQIEILNLDDAIQKELLGKLLTNVVMATGDNPSKTLEHKSHDEKSPLSEYLDKVWPLKKKDKED